MEKFQEHYAVVFSGGGALGAWEVGAYKAITKFLDRQPRTIIGSSAGALNAAAIFANHDIPDLEELWKISSSKVYSIRFLTIMFTLLPPIFSLPIIKYLLKGRYESFLDTNPLRKKVKEVLENIQSLHDTKIDFAITLTDIVNSEKHVHYWMSEDRIPLPGTTVSLYEKIKCKQDLVDSLIATSAIPLIFPPSSHRFFDGGILNNNPLSVAHQIGETIIFVLAPSLTNGKEISQFKGIINIFSCLMDTYINLNLKEVVYSLKLRNSIKSFPKTKVCIIRPTDDFAKLKVGLLSFGKKINDVVLDGEKAAENRIKTFDLNSQETWF
jgi:NTE family protein